MSAANSPSVSSPDFAIPTEFPRAKFGAVSGFQSKILAVKSGDSYTQGMSESEAHARYKICIDLVNQLQAYCIRKLAQYPEWTLDEFQRKLRVGVCRRYDWNCSNEELRWILKQVYARMNWEETPEFLAPLEFVSLCPEFEITDPKIIDRLLGRKYTEAGDLIPPEPAPETVVDHVKRMLAISLSKGKKEE